MKRLIGLFLTLTSVMLVLFLCAEAFEIEWVPQLDGQSAQATGRQPYNALLGSGLLVLDVILPIPSSLIMMLNGRAFGFVWGTGVSLAGAMGGTVLAFWLGRFGRKYFGQYLSDGKDKRGQELLERHGALAILMTRPIPMLAESVAIMAGTTRLSWGTVLLASLGGNLPTCAIYGYAGASLTGLQYPILALVLLMALSGGFFLWLSRRSKALRPSE